MYRLGNSLEKMWNLVERMGNEIKIQWISLEIKGNLMEKNHWKKDEFIGNKLEFIENKVELSEIHRWK